VTRGGAVR